MLPTRAYAGNIPRLSPGGTQTGRAVDARPALILAAAALDVERFPVGNFTRYPVHTTVDALRMIDTTRPRLVVVDWDAMEIDAAQVCAAARKFAQTAVLATMSNPESAPAALKGGCHAILLKPFAPNLVAARIGRLAREMPATPTPARAALTIQQFGTNRVWPDTHCPTCNAASATSFEFASYRRTWYACLACDAVWLGPRQE